MDDAREPASTTYPAAVRLPGETLEAHLIRRAARMRQIHADLAAFGEANTTGGGFSDRLVDEERRLRLGPDEERIRYGRHVAYDIAGEIRAAKEAVAAAKAGVVVRLDEIAQLVAEERRAWERYRRARNPDREAVEAQYQLTDLDWVDHVCIRNSLRWAHARLAESREAGWLIEASSCETEVKELRERLIELRKIAPSAEAIAAIEAHPGQPRFGPDDGPGAEFSQARWAVMERIHEAVLTDDHELIRQLEEEADVLLSKGQYAESILAGEKVVPAEILEKFDQYPNHPPLPDATGPGRAQMAPSRGPGRR